jgi:hypothetical protein
MRYEIRAIANADASRIKPEVIDFFDDLVEAIECATKQKYYFRFGLALIDTKTGYIDFSFAYPAVNRGKENGTGAGNYGV